MKKRMKFISLLLAAALLLSLAACGKTETEEKPNGPEAPLSSEYGYKAEFRKIDELASNSMYPILFTEEGIYASRFEPVESEEPEEDEAEPEDGETAEDTEAAADADVLYYSGSGSGNYEYRYYFIGYDGSLRQLDGYVPLAAKDNPEGYQDYDSSSSLESLVMTGDGKILAFESVYVSYYNGPEGLSYDDDDYWSYRYWANDYYIRLLNPDLSEIRSTKIDLGEEDYFYPYSVVSDGNGHLLTPHDMSVWAFDEDGRIAYRIETENYVENLVRLGDGRVGAVTWGDEGEALLLLDLEHETAGDSYKMPFGAYELIPGDENYAFYYSSGSNFYGYDLETQTAEKVLNWVNCDVVGTSLRGIHVDPDGTVTGLMSTWDGNYEYATTELVTLNRVPAASLPQKERLTMAMQWFDTRLAEQVIRFNRNNEQYRIEIADYSEYNTEDDYEAGLTKLTTEIAAGNVPDILVLDNLPYTQWAARGIFEDLYPYLDADPELSRGDFFENVFAGLEVDGKLYQVCPSFYIDSVIGANSVVGDTPGWTIAQFDAALASMPDGCEPFESYVTKSDILNACLSMDMDSFVDWGTGECRFNSAAFIELLEFANRFVDEFNWDEYIYEDVTERITQGKQMLLRAGIYSVEDVRYYDYYFGGEGKVTYIGYPTNSGVGNGINPRSGYAISARCAHKDAAWDFLRSFLTEDYQLSYYGLPTNRHAFQEELEKAMTPEYQTDEAGKPVLDEDGQPIRIPYTTFYTPTGEEYPIYELSQAQADKLLELVESTEKVMGNNNVIYDKVREMAQAYFSGQQDAQKVAESIQSALFLYINEQR